MAVTRALHATVTAKPPRFFLLYAYAVAALTLIRRAWKDRGAAWLARRFEYEVTFG